VSQKLAKTKQGCIMNMIIEDLLCFSQLLIYVNVLTLQLGRGKEGSMPYLTLSP